MRFDDRLQTMLDAPVADDRDRAVRWRQLVDLLARDDQLSRSAAAEEALRIVERDAFAIDERVRAATVRAIAGRPIAPDLMRIFAAQPVRIAAPLFAGLTLSEVQAGYMLADADPEVRALVQVALSEPLPATPSADTSPLPPADPPRISEMVDRMVRLREDRASAAEPPSQSLPQSLSGPGQPAPEPAGATSVTMPAAGVAGAASGAAQAGRISRTAAPREADPRLFEWESDASGQIAWVEGAPRGAFVGRPLGGEGVGLLDRQVSARLSQRHPFVDVPLLASEVLAGAWSATGVPAFDPASGRFLGYRGLARRTDGEGRRTVAAPETDLDALRELVHEIKTPLNAILGFAEIIDGQYLGPAHARYRERAASIVGQARQLLDAVEDLDFAARLRAERESGPARGGRLSELFPPIAAALEACLAVHGGILELDLEADRDRCALSPEMAGRLVRRLLLSLCQLAARDEVFRVAVTRRGSMCLLSVARPRALDGIGEVQLVDPGFDPARSPEGQGVGLGFALRLVRGLAQVAGGRLAIDEHRITLELPALD